MNKPSKRRTALSGAATGMAVNFGVRAVTGGRIRPTYAASAGAGAGIALYQRSQDKNPRTPAKVGTHQPAKFQGRAKTKGRGM